MISHDSNIVQSPQSAFEVIVPPSQLLKQSRKRKGGLEAGPLSPFLQFKRGEEICRNRKMMIKNITSTIVNFRWGFTFYGHFLIN